MKPAAFEYARAKDVAEAVKYLGSQRGEAKLIAGGQSLGPMLNLRLARPKLLVDIMDIGSLKIISDEGSAWRIGSGVTHAHLEDSRLTGCELLADVARGIAHRAIRNRGTIGGSLVHADPAGDWPLALAALGATLRIQGPVGIRDLDADKLSTAAFCTVLTEDEVLESICVPKLSGSARWGYFKLCRKTGDFPHASAATLVDPGRKVSRAFVGCLDKPPSRLPAVSAAIAADPTKLDRQAIETDLGQLGLALAGPQRKMHATAIYRSIQTAFSA